VHPFFDETAHHYLLVTKLCKRRLLEFVRTKGVRLDRDEIEDLDFLSLRAMDDSR
jgi:hypothetical protein